MLARSESDMSAPELIQGDDNRFRGTPRIRGKGPLWVENRRSCGSRDLTGLTCNYLVYPSFECLLCIWSGCFPRRPVAAHSGLHETARHACTKAVKAIFADQAFFMLPERVFHADNQRHAPVAKLTPLHFFGRRRASVPHTGGCDHIGIGKHARHSCNSSRIALMDGCLRMFCCLVRL